MEIRKFEENDLSQVLEICREVRNHHIEVLEGYFIEQDDKYEKLPFLQSLSDDKIVAFVAVDKGFVVGYLLAEMKKAPYLVEQNVVHIANFGVSKSYRKKGIGKMLMDCLVAYCKKLNYDEIRLGCFNKNKIAYSFYENYGFEPFEQRMNIRLKD